VNHMIISLVNQCSVQSERESLDEFVSESVFSAVKESHLTISLVNQCSVQSKRVA
jgi:hypothetical protein